MFLCLFLTRPYVWGYVYQTKHWRNFHLNIGIHATRNPFSIKSGIVWQKKNWRKSPSIPSSWHNNSRDLELSHSNGSEDTVQIYFFPQVDSALPGGDVDLIGGDLVGAAEDPTPASHSQPPGPEGDTATFNDNLSIFNALLYPINCNAEWDWEKIIIIMASLTKKKNNLLSYFWGMHWPTQKI